MLATYDQNKTCGVHAFFSLLHHPFVIFYLFFSLFCMHVCICLNFWSFWSDISVTLNSSAQDNERNWFKATALLPKLSCSHTRTRLLVLSSFFTFASKELQISSCSRNLCGEQNTQHPHLILHQKTSSFRALPYISSVGALPVHREHGFEIWLNLINSDPPLPSSSKHFLESLVVGWSSRV